MSTPSSSPEQSSSAQDEPTRRYMAAVTTNMVDGELQISQDRFGSLWGVVGRGSYIIGDLDISGHQMICVATLDEVTPRAVDDFRRHVDAFARSLRKELRSGVFGIAALVTPHMHPAARKVVRNRFTSFGSLIVPAVADLGTRQLHIAANKPIAGRAVWGPIRDQARRYLPEPGAVLA